MPWITNNLAWLVFKNQKPAVNDILYRVCLPNNTTGTLMNKKNPLLLLALVTVFLSGCADKKQYEAAILAQMQTEQDIKDYKLDPQLMTDCMVQTTSKKMPGLFPTDPDRIKAYQGYIKMLSLNKSQNPQQVMNELRDAFGSPQGLLDAHNNYAQSMVECQTGFISNAETIETPVDPATPTVSPAAPVATPEPAK